MNLLHHRPGRIALFALLYLSEGAPIGFIWWALPTLLRREGVELPRITTLTAILVLPWAFKFLWAPFVDAGRTPRWGFRSWIITCQLGMGAALLPLVWLDPVAHFGSWAALLLFHAFLAATQDVAIDALAINSAPASERGLLNGCMQAGMLVGRSVFGGGALLVATSLGRAWLLAGLIGCIWLISLMLFFVVEPAMTSARRGRLTEFGEHMTAALRKQTTWLGLGFALLAAAGFEATGQLTGPFLLDRGLPERTIGLFFGVCSLTATLAGGLLGGHLSDRWGRLRSVAISLVGFVTLIATLAVVDLSTHQVPPAILLSLLTGMYLFIGLFTAASYALFMDLTDPRLGGTQFSAFMSATNGCESWSAWAGGQLAGRANYGTSFLAMSAVSLLSLTLLRRLNLDRPQSRAATCTTDHPACGDAGSTSKDQG